MKDRTLLIISAKLFLLMAACNLPQETTTSSILFSIDGSDRDTIRLYQLDPIAFTELHTQELILDGTGSGTMEIDFPVNSFVYVRIADIVFSIIHTVGSDLLIQGNVKDLPNSLDISGKKSLPNEYLFAKKSIVGKYNALDGQYFFQLDSIEFWDRIAALDKEIDSLNTWLTSKKLDPKLESLLILESQQHANVLILNYALVYGHTGSTYSIDIPYDENLYNSYSPNYLTVLSGNYNHQLLGPTWVNSGASTNDSVANDFPLLLYETIHTLEIPEFAKDFYISWLLFSYFGENLTSPALEGVYTQWLNKYPQSIFRNTISTVIDNMSFLAQGEEAPVIKGIDPKGNNFTMEELKGKIIYVDVWATWCSGCVKKIPHMYALQEEFKDQSQMAFLFVSMDKDLDKWMNYISKLPDATHINSSNTDIFKDYMVGGIPHYILIDASGNIIHSNATDPDTKTIKKVLEKALQEM